MQGSITLPAEHSPFGGSSAYRYIACPGSVNMSAGIEDEESEFATLGTAAHALAAACLNSADDAWEFMGETLEGTIVDADMADAVQVYLDAVRGQLIDSEAWVEFPFHAKDIHPQMFGRSDLVLYSPTDRHLHVWDYKHGIGIVVGVKYNAQTLYYAIGVLEQLALWDKVDHITTWIAQPRGFHPDGPIRSFTYSLKEVAHWLFEVLLPAMALAEVSRDTVAGEHCRFCPARSHGCPALMGNNKELSRMTAYVNEKGGAPELSPDEVGDVLTTFAIAKIQEKAVRSVALARLNKDNPVPGWKLVSGRVSRGWKEGVFGPAFDEFASQAFVAGMEGMAALLIKKEVAVKPMLNKDTIKSPAQFDKLPGGKEFCARWASKPPAPRTLAPAEDARRGLSTSVKTLFKPISKQA